MARLVGIVSDIERRFPVVFMRRNLKKFIPKMAFSMTMIWR